MAKAGQRDLCRSRLVGHHRRCERGCGREHPGHKRPVLARSRGSAGHRRRKYLARSGTDEEGHRLIPVTRGDNLAN